MSPVVAVLVPVLRRVHRLAPFLESLEAATPLPHETVFLTTTGDGEVIAEARRLAALVPSLVVAELAPNRVGDYARKINHGVSITSAPFVFTGADDLAFHPGWLPAALAPFTDPAVGVVGTNDLAPTVRARAGEHSTHFVARRSYVTEFGTIDEPGKLLHEGYPHEYVDDELVATAKLRGAWRYAAGAVVEHLHPSWGKAPTDELYAAQARRMIEGRRLFARRRRLWARKPSR